MSLLRGSLGRYRMRETFPRILRQILDLNPPIRRFFFLNLCQFPIVWEAACVFYAPQSLSMYAAVRAPVPGVKSYWHNKGMFIHGGDESADVGVTCDDNLIELWAYWGDEKETPLIKTSRLGYRQGWGPTGPVSVNSSVPQVIIPTWWHDEQWKLAALHVPHLASSHSGSVVLTPGL